MSNFPSQHKLRGDVNIDFHVYIDVDIDTILDVNANAHIDGGLDIFIVTVMSTLT